MDIAKPATVASIGATPATPGPTGRGVAGQTAEQDSGSPSATGAVVDRLDIGLLTVPGALQILLAEVREALGAELAVLPPLPAGMQPPQSPDQAAYRLVELYLQTVSLDEEPAPEPGSLLAQLAHIDAGTQAGFERALQVVSAWREVTPAVIASLQEARGIMANALAPDEAIADEAAAMVSNAAIAWSLRPEWLRLAPRLDRLRRLRRKFRGPAHDPDARDPTLPFA